MLSIINHLGIGGNVSSLSTTSKCPFKWPEPYVGIPDLGIAIELELKEEGHLSSGGGTHRAGPWPWEQFCFPPSQGFWSAIQGSDAFSDKREIRDRSNVLKTFDLWGTTVPSSFCWQLYEAPHYSSNKFFFA